MYIPKRGRTLAILGRRLCRGRSATNSDGWKSPSLTADLQPLTTAVLDGRAVGPPLCGGFPPATPPPSYNMPRRQGVDIGDRCLIDRVSQIHVPSVPACPCRGGPCACPGTPSNQPPRDRAGPGTCPESLQESAETLAATAMTSPPDFSHPKFGVHPIQVGS